MKGLLDEFLTDAELSALEKVDESADVPFSELVNLAGLDPKRDLQHTSLCHVDFRRSDIRGFNFTGADLRFSIKDETTIEDGTTIYDNADELWIPVAAAPIIDLMFRVHGIGNGPTLASVMTTMIADHPFSRAHIDQFILKEVRLSKSLDRIVLLADFLSDSISFVERLDVRSVVADAIASRGHAAKRHAGRASKSNIDTERIVNLFKNGNSRFLREATSVIQSAVLDLAWQSNRTVQGLGIVTPFDISLAVRASSDDLDL